MTPPTGEATTAVAARTARLWHVIATIGAVTLVSAVQVVVEFPLIGFSEFASIGTAIYLLVRLIGGAASIALFTAISAWRRGRPTSLPYSERYLVGLGYGLATSLIISIVFGVFAASSPGEAVESAGVMMTISLITGELPVAGIVGGITWHVLTKVRGPAPDRPRRPWEDE